MRLKKDLNELKEIDEKVKTKLNYIRNTSDIMKSNINEVKALKNDIYEKASKTFIYNLKKLIQLELTQKNLAKKICISEDLLSKYKTGDAFPSIETLVYICEVYNISIDKLVSHPLTSIDIENFTNNQIIFDLGINNNNAEQLVKGDVYFDPMKNYPLSEFSLAAVPGGVGPLTVINLLENVYTARLKNDLEK